MLTNWLGKIKQHWHKYVQNCLAATLGTIAIMTLLQPELDSVTAMDKH